MPKWKGLFEQAERWLGLVVLLVAILLVFGSVAQHDQRQVALEATSPSRSPTPIAEAYPPPLPPPSRTPEAYPPPTFLPPPTVSAATETATPTPAPTPTAFVSGLKIMWAEAPMDNGMVGTATVWIADVGDLAGRTALYTVQDLPQGHYLARASLSPDGTRLAYVTEPYKPGRTPSNGVPQVIDLQDKLQQVLAGSMRAYVPADGYPIWSPDGRTLAYAKVAPKSVPPADEKDEDPWRTELHVLAADGRWTRAVVADDAERPNLIGWTPDGKVLYSRWTRRGDELWTVDTSGSKAFVTLMHTQPVRVNPHLSPDRRKMVFFTYGPLGVYEGLVCLSTDGGDRKDLGSSLERQWNVGGWVSNDELVLQIGLATYRILNVRNGSYRDITVARPPENTSYSLSPPTSHGPVLLSPDGQWWVLNNYNTGQKSLMRLNTEISFRITDNWFAFLGWLTSAS